MSINIRTMWHVITSIDLLKKKSTASVTTMHLNIPLCLLTQIQSPKGGEPAGVGGAVGKGEERAGGMDVGRVLAAGVRRE